MAEWKTHLKADPIDWLLETDNPSVRFLSLTKLLDKPESDPEVVEARALIMQEGTVPEILAKQEKGSWNPPRRFYLDKYSGTVWQLIILAELMADGEHPRIKKACEYILAVSQDRESNGFSQNESAKTGGGRHSEVIPCLTGNMVWSLIRLGYMDDPRVKAAIDWITQYQRFDDGIDEAPKGWPYDRYEICWGNHTCHMGVVKALKALAEIPEDQRTKAMEETIKGACEYLLIHHIYKRSHDLSKVSKPGWLRFQFPLMYQTDLLEIARLLAELGVKDERMEDAIERIIKKQNDAGQWELSTTFNGRFQVDIEKKGEVSKWITLHALRTLKSFFSD